MSVVSPQENQKISFDTISVAAFPKDASFPNTRKSLERADLLASNVRFPKAWQTFTTDRGEKMPVYTQQGQEWSADVQK